MKVLVSGARGLVGSALCSSLARAGHAVVRLVRRTPLGPDEIAWSPAAGTLDGGALEGIDAAVHLAGESLAAKRWTPEVKAEIRGSRVRGTALLATTLARLARPPRVLVSASAMGYYGDRGDAVLTESSGPGRGFLAEACVAWEEATQPARMGGIRVVTPRIALVLAASGGALERLVPLFRSGFGGPLGSGRAWWSWIALDDLVAVIERALTDESLAGPVNAASPSPVTNAEFTRTLARVLGRPALLPVPPIALKLALGEMADQALLASARLEPRALAERGFPFRFPELESALRHALGRAR